MPGLLQLRANLAADISHVVSFREVKLDFELLLLSVRAFAVREQNKAR